MPTTLVTAAETARHIDDSSWRIVDCRFDLGDPNAGQTAFSEGHIPGAVYADLDRDLALPAGEGGRHPLPDRQALAQCFGKWGIGNATQVVAYDGDNGMVACRFWWLARWLGLESVAVLDGGLAAWSAAGGDLQSLASVPTPASFEPQTPLTRVVEAPEILKADARLTLIDARTEERFAGHVEPLDFKAGHIPGAVCRPYANNLGTDGRFLGAESLRQRFADLDGDLVCYCGSGVSAAHNIMALKVAGFAEPSLYPGSWSEWIRDDNRPIEP